MTWTAELSNTAEQDLRRVPRDARDRTPNHAAKTLAVSAILIRSEKTYR
jgi:hypothetical protein